MAIVCAKMIINTRKFWGTVVLDKPKHKTN